MHWAPEAGPSLVAGLAFQGSPQVGTPIPSQEVAAAHLQCCLMDLQQLPQERLLVEVVSPHKHQGLVVCQTLAGRAVADLAQDAVGGVHLQVALLPQAKAFEVHFRSIWRPARSSPLGSITSVLWSQSFTTYALTLAIQRCSPLIKYTCKEGGFIDNAGLIC